MEKFKAKYGLFTAIAMIVGICIGSGIFFKSDNILVATGGSIPLGVLVFVFGAIAIIFGGLSIGELAALTDKPGGIVSYAEEFASKKLACALGWFQIFIYCPALIAVVSWIVGVYTCILFNLTPSLLMQSQIGFAFIIICFAYNTISPKLGGLFQNAATIIKLVPLLLLAVLGMVFGNPIEGLKNVGAQTVGTAAWLSAIGPIAFSYDGWIVSTNISHEVKNSKKNMPRALAFAPLFVLLAYTLYFVGISCYVGPEKIVALGDEHVAFAAEKLLGAFFSKAITVFIIISVMGTVNGLVLGFIRLPYSLTLRHAMIPFSKNLSAVNKHFDMPINSAIFAFIVSTIWLGIHYYTSKFKLLPNSDVSEISISVSYLLYIFLYYQVFRLYRKKKIKGILRGIIFPLLATAGSLLILFGGLQNKLFILYALICMIILAASQQYYCFKSRRKPKSE